MTEEIPKANADGRSQRRGVARAFRRQLLLAARVAQVRLRFVIVLVAAFLVVGLWGSLRNYWDTWTHKFGGPHFGQHAVSQDTEYWCPMDPGVVSDWPAICPVCNMDLVRRKKGEAIMLPEGLVARMQFSPYRIQLAGIKTSLVARRLLTRQVTLAGRLVMAPPADSFESEAATQERAVANFILECEVDPGDSRLLAPGQRAKILFEALPTVEPFTGHVEETPPADVQAANRRSAVRIRLDERHATLKAGEFGTARIETPLELEQFAPRTAAAHESPAAGFVAVPETAVIDTGSRRIVYVETMPGMFDGVEVTLGPRCGDYFPVLAGLEAGQNVATIGAFLIDAEARLSRNVAASYFGAARTGEESSGNSASPTASIGESAEKKRETPKERSKKSKLSPADRRRADEQKICPVTDLPLDSMGGPIAVEVEGQRVFICCQGCESKLKKDPQKYLAKVKAR